MLVKQAGGESVAVDCFADQDTYELSLECVKVKTLDLVYIRREIERLQAQYEIRYLVYGSGFECHLDSLYWLEERFFIIGNSADLFSRLNDKRALFECLSSLSIPFPESCFKPPATNGNWLVKPKMGTGGLGIARFDSESNAVVRDVYWQEYKPGNPMSVLFAVAGQEVALLGFNQQSFATNKAQSFLFAGVSSAANLPIYWQSSIKQWLYKLLPFYPMRGVGSLDFIFGADGVHVLEINGRIPASAQLYGSSLFKLHWYANLGRLIEIEPVLPCAYRVIFAAKDLVIPVGISWPEWVVDRPVYGAFIGEGSPICSIITSGIDAADVENRLQRHIANLEHLLQTGLLNHAISGKR